MRHYSAMRARTKLFFNFKHCNMLNFTDNKTLKMHLKSKKLGYNFTFGKVLYTVTEKSKYFVAFESKNGEKYGYKYSPPKRKIVHLVSGSQDGTLGIYSNKKAAYLSAIDYITNVETKGKKINMSCNDFLKSDRWYNEIAFFTGEVWEGKKLTDSYSYATIEAFYLNSKFED